MLLHEQTLCVILLCFIFVQILSNSFPLWISVMRTTLVSPKNWGNWLKIKDWLIKVAANTQHCIEIVRKFCLQFFMKRKIKGDSFNNQKLFSTDNHVRVWVTSHANAYPIFQFDISCSTLFSSRFHPIHWINNKAPSDPSLLFLYKSHCIWKFGVKDKLKEKKNTNWYLSEEFSIHLQGMHWQKL